VKIDAELRAALGIAAVLDEKGIGATATLKN